MIIWGRVKDMAIGEIMPVTASRWDAEEFGIERSLIDLLTKEGIIAEIAPDRISKRFVKIREMRD